MLDNLTHSTNPICRIIGHKFSTDDEGRLICKRCNYTWRGKTGKEFGRLYEEKGIDRRSRNRLLLLLLLVLFVFWVIVGITIT